jgi:predicted site-specific integrase-resolvase
MNTNLLTPKKAAETLGVAIGTLAVWRCTARYSLPFVKIGRRVMYREQDISDFIENGLNDSSSLEVSYA